MAIKTTYYNHSIISYRNVQESDVCRTFCQLGNVNSEKTMIPFWLTRFQLF